MTLWSWHSGAQRLIGPEIGGHRASFTVPELQAMGFECTEAGLRKILPRYDQTALATGPAAVQAMRVLNGARR